MRHLLHSVLMVNELSYRIDIEFRVEDKLTILNEVSNFPYNSSILYHNLFREFTFKY